MYTAGKQDFFGKMGMAENDFRSLLNFATNHGKNSLKEKDFLKHDDSISLTYRTHFKDLFEDPIDAIFDLYNDVQKNDEMKKALGIKSY